RPARRGLRRRGGHRRRGGDAPRARPAEERGRSVPPGVARARGPRARRGVVGPVPIGVGFRTTRPRRDR
ncbi:MAG: hypothetical protein ACK55I_43600, partial [bacterium]